MLFLYVIYLGAYVSKSKRYYRAKPGAYYFYLKTKITVDFHICPNVRLIDSTFILLFWFFEKYILSKNEINQLNPYLLNTSYKLLTKSLSARGASHHLILIKDARNFSREVFLYLTRQLCGIFPRKNTNTGATIFRMAEW